MTAPAGQPLRRLTDEQQRTRLLLLALRRRRARLRRHFRATRLWRSL